MDKKARKEKKILKNQTRIRIKKKKKMAEVVDEREIQNSKREALN